MLMWRRPVWPLLALVVILISAGIPAFGNADDLPTIVVRVDDCSGSWITPRADLNGKSPLLYARDKRIPITWGIIVDATNNGGAIPWNDLKDYLDFAGGEPASHSCHHSSINSPEQAAGEVALSKAAIELMIPGYKCTSFIQPGSWSGDAYLSSYRQLDGPLAKSISGTYDQSMAYVTAGAPCGSVYYKHCMCAQMGFDARWTNWTPEATSATLDAISNCAGTMFIWQLHNVGGDPKTQICVSEASFKTFVDRLAELRNAGRIRILSFRDACARSVSPGINLAPDPGFLGTTLGALNPCGPWSREGYTTIAAAGGVGNSRYARMPNSSSNLSTCQLALAPGRYELSWSQKPEPGSANSSGLTVDLTLCGASPTTHVLNSLPFRNTDRTAWERKSVLFLVDNNMPTARLLFRPGPGDGFGIDDVSLVLSPLDPSLSPSNLKAVPGHGNCSLSWDTPAHATTICVRYSAAAWPVTPDDGEAFATIDATPGKHQDITAPIDWSGAAVMHFSAFAIRPNGFSPPDIARVSVDRTPPWTHSVLVAVQSPGVVDARWSAVDAESTIALYRYAVGTSLGMDDVLAWTTVAEPHVTVSGLPEDAVLWISVESENLFGFRSSAAASNAFSAGGIGAAFRQADGAVVTVHGRVSAVLGDRAYIQEVDRTRGIAVLGRHSWTEGGLLTVTGAMTTTSSGERAIVPD